MMTALSGMPEMAGDSGMLNDPVTAEPLPLNGVNRIMLQIMPEDGCIIFENVCLDAPVYIQCFINREKKLLFIRRCGPKADYAVRLASTGDGEPCRIRDCKLFIGLLYSIMGQHNAYGCRLQSSDDIELPFSCYGFELSKARFITEAPEEGGLTRHGQGIAERGEDT